MALYERLAGYTGSGQPLPDQVRKLNTHAFVAMMAERRRGRVTNAQVIAGLDLDAGEQTELVTLVTRMQGGSGLLREELEDVLYCAEARIAPYDSVAAVTTRLGV